jgi:phosphoenolpyruvate-protein phosphotransferase (PTS system enzyme I)
MNSNTTDHAFKGVSASPGIAIGHAYVLTGDVVKVDQRIISNDQIDEEIQRFREAIDTTKDDLLSIQRKAKFKIGEDGEKLFDVYRMLLEDSFIIDETIEQIRKENKNADFTYFMVMQRFQESLESTGDEYFAGRATDIRDVKRRVIRNIQKKSYSLLKNIPDQAIIVARELTPLDTVQLDRQKVVAFITDLGGKTSHAAIMAMSLQIPAVVGLTNITRYVNIGDELIVDGKHGEVYVHPSESLKKKYHKFQDEYRKAQKKLSLIRKLPCRTLDGKDIELAANIEFPEEVESVISFGARGVGLYRSEFQYLRGDELPTEAELFNEYMQVAESINPHPVIIRTLDLGGDKQPRCITFPEEENPFLGLRAIRFSLERQDIFRTQLRAILRASIHGNVKIMFPMISSIQEIRRVKIILAEIKQQLKNDNLPFDESIDIGAMIEVPAAAIVSDIIAREVDFLSIGTNDLIQYTTAVDRGNERISHLYKRLPLPVLRLVRNIVESGHQQGVWVGMCGEMAGDPMATLILLGLGMDELSVTPSSLPTIKTIIRSMTFKEAQRISEKALSLNSSEQIDKYIQEIMESRFKELL